jgi:formiminotetrahydrofolate cyclodeaminase
MTFANMTLKEFTSKLSSNSPTPGGGSVAGLSISLGASLASMVVNLTKDGSLDKYSDDLKEHTDFALELIDKDANSFNKVMDAFKMKKDTDQEIKERKKVIQSALYNASLTPLETIKLGVEVLEITKEVAKNGNKNAVSDAGVAALMALAGVKGAAYNVFINSSSLSDDKKAKELEDKTNKLVKKSEKLADQVEEICLSKL